MKNLKVQCEKKIILHFWHLWSVTSPCVYLTYVYGWPEALFFKYNTVYYLLVKPVGAFFSLVLMLSLSHQPYTALGRRENISRQVFSWRLRHMLSILEMSQLPTGSTKNKWFKLYREYWFSRPAMAGRWVFKIHYPLYPLQPVVPKKRNNGFLLMEALSHLAFTVAFLWN